MALRSKIIVENFNSRTHVECDDCNIAFSDYNIHFNSRTHVECDTNFQKQFRDPTHFNSRTHVECDCCLRFAQRIQRNFNSRTHVECDGVSVCTPQQVPISTHALTWSATS